MYNMAEIMAPHNDTPLARYAAAVAYLRSCSTSSLSDGDTEAFDAATRVDAATEALYEVGRHCSYEPLPWQL